jgi:methylene-tetrahydromethanopterin dehydrogenase
MLFPGANASPFDVNMAADAGYEVIVPYTHIAAGDVTALVQDAIFSRPPKMFAHTAAFFGGWDVNLAAEMLEQAQQAMVPPFEISVFADPNGAYTTAAALVALVAKHLRTWGKDSYRDIRVKVFGGGPVGLCAAILIAREGGKPALVRLTPPRADKQEAISRFSERYGVSLAAEDGETDEQKVAALQDAEVVITTAKAGVQVLSKQLLRNASGLMVAADVNAVPPAGVEGVDPNDNGVELGVGLKAVGIGALAIGEIKYQIQHELFKRMLETDKALALDFPDAYQLAREKL